MKKFILAILSLVYLATASGVVIGTHYCIGRIADASYTYSDNDKCSKCGMDNKNGCCHTEFKIVKLTDDQQQAKADINFDQTAIALVHFSLSLLQPVQAAGTPNAIILHSPPEWPDSPLYLSNSVFRI